MLQAGSFKWRNNSIEEKKKLEKGKRQAKIEQEKKDEVQAEFNTVKRKAQKQKTLADKYKARIQKSSRLQMSN